MELSEAIAIVLKERRNKINLSQEELGFKSGLDRTYISLIERGLRQPTLNTIFNICKSIKIEPHEFVKDIENLIKSKA